MENKMYFTKYLSIKGEIKENEKFLFNNKIYTCNSIEGDKSNPEEWWIDFELDGEITCILQKDAQKVKLFLCSRDIQVGNDFQYGDGEPENICKGFTNQRLQIIDEGGNWHDVNKPFKVIGEISPGALWVKEGDEFDEYRWIWEPGEDMETEYLTEEQKQRDKRTKKYADTVALKGQCGYFH